jgi:hypothetical protein
MIGQFRNKTTTALAALALTALVAAPATTLAAAQSPVTIPIVGTILTGGTFNGALTLTSFAVQNGQVVANGTLSGVLTNAAGAVTSVLATVTMPVSVTQTTCQILHLDLGPLSLNLLGLQVDLSQVVLDITAHSGAGNLLGNLLCSVAGLLDSPGGLSRVLNQILGILQGV